MFLRVLLGAEVGDYFVSYGIVGVAVATLVDVDVGGDKLQAVDEYIVANLLKRVGDGHRL